MKNKKPQIIHRVILPSAWLVLVLLSWHWPGDKGLSFFFASIAGAWVHELVRLRGIWYLVGQCAGGLPIMFALGWVLDRTGVGATLYLAYVPFVGLGVWTASQYFPEMFMVLCWGLYAVGTVGLIAVVTKRLRRKLHNK